MENRRVQKSTTLPNRLQISQCKITFFQSSSRVSSFLGYDALITWGRGSAHGPLFGGIFHDWHSLGLLARCKKKERKYAYFCWIYYHGFSSLQQSTPSSMSQKLTSPICCLWRASQVPRIVQVVGSS